MFRNKKFIILGCPGSGKSAFAAELAAITGIEVFHLDNIWWQEDRSHISRKDFDRRLAEIMEKDRWIIDGDYSRTYETRIRNCDTVVFLDYETDICLEGISKRIGQKREDIPWIEEKTDPELEEEVRRYRDDKRPLLYELFRKYPEKELIIFKNRRKAAEWLKEVTNDP